MASTDSTSIAQVFDALVALEDSFQRLDSNATRALVIRDAREMIAALSAEQDRLLGTIAALNVELSRRPNLAINRPWSFDEAGTSYVDDWDPDRSHLDADLAGDQIANIIYDNGAGEDIDGDGDAWGIVTEYLDGALNLVNEARHRFPELDEWLTSEGRWPQRREAPEATG